MEIDKLDDDDLDEILHETKTEREEKIKPGRGNAVTGQKEEYNLYPSSDVFDRVCLRFLPKKLTKKYIFYKHTALC